MLARRRCIRVTHTETARIFLDGEGQAVEIPDPYRFTTDELYIRRDAQSGDLILSERPLKPSLAEIFAVLDGAGVPNGFLADSDQRPPQERDEL